jgi:hypothetical protein
MNEAELREFEARRQPGHAGRLEVEKLSCYGCAHSAAGQPFPSRPSGERPCCSCVRNPELEDWAKESKVESRVTVDDHGTARDFNPFTGHAYNGAPYVHWPMDNYITLDQHDQERFYDQHPEYAKPIRFDAAGNCIVVVEE